MNDYKTVYSVLDFCLSSYLFIQNDNRSLYIHRWPYKRMAKHREAAKRLYGQR